MKVIHLSFSKSGGAGRAAAALSAELSALGVDSAHYWLTETDLHSNPFKNAGVTGLAALDYWLVRRRNSPSLFTLFRSRLSNLDLQTSGLSAQPEAVLHTHWIPGLISIPDLSEAIQKGARHVSTLHDLWMVTGGCHHPNDCLSFSKAGCKECPQSHRKFHPQVEDYYKQKNTILTQTHLVAPSKWSLQMARNHPAVTDQNSSFIPNIAPNGSENEVTRRRELDGPVQLLFVAKHVDDPAKGFRYFFELMDTHPRVRAGEVRLVVVGARKRPIRRDWIDFKGFLTPESLAEQFALADSLIIPSKVDSAPTIIEEAMRHGTPIAASEVGGIPEALDGYSTATLIQNSEQWERFLSDVEKRTETRDDHGLHDRQALIRRNQESALMHLKLYQRLLNST